LGALFAFDGGFGFAAVFDLADFFAFAGCLDGLPMTTSLQDGQFRIANEPRAIGLQLNAYLIPASVVSWPHCCCSREGNSNLVASLERMEARPSMQATTWERVTALATAA
jgi:hypothetical protein